MKITQFPILVLLVGAVLFTSSCNLYPDDDARIDEFDAVITYYERTNDFGAYKTYAIVDSVRQLSPSNEGIPGGDNVVRNSDYILDLINTNMQARNYDLVDNPNDADIIVNAGALVVNNIVISGGGYPGYWYGYPGDWYGPGYWWGYPGYGYYYPWVPIGFVTEYEVGTLIIDIVDRVNFNPNNDDQLLIKWSGVVRGVIGVTDNADVRNRLRIDINQAFDQSPYLQSEL